MKSDNPPIKKLKLSFAMGGGVSLGAFSGAALTEALKLLLIGGLDDEGRRYTHIELDSMSGASAGAVSLCIMLSCLLNYKRYISPIKPTPDNKFDLSDIDTDLSNQFGSDWQHNHAQHVEALRALQVAQKLQEKLWVEKVNMDELIRLKTIDLENKDSVSLLDRSLLVELVNEYILEDLEQINNGESYIVSKDRFLFACSLTNLIPLALGNGDNQNDLTEPLVKELQKAHASYNHKELRLFDFQLNRKTKEEKSRLTKAITIGKNKSFQFQIDQPDTWSIVSATCLACAAFPFAFEPVVLKRFKYEYKIKEQEVNVGYSTPETQPQANMVDGNMPMYQADVTTKYNRKIEQSVPWSTHKKKHLQTAENANLADVSETDEEYFFFSYIDGGTLNNEPIREAFRMANYLDSRDDTPKADYDRIVIFVDPIVRTEPIKHNSPSFYSYNVENKHNRLYVRKNGEWNRLTSYTSKLISTLRDQGAIKEEHKISTYMSSVNLNKKLTMLIESSPFPGDFTIDFIETILEFLRFQAQQNNDDQISTFDINDRRFIEVVIKKYLRAQQSEEDFDELFSNFYRLVDILRQHEEKNNALDVITDELNVKIDAGYKATIKKLFYHNILQAVLDADGKDPGAMRMAITPVRYNVGPTDEIEEPVTIELPGSEFEAFGGFANLASRAFSNEYGRLCAYQSLSRGDFRKYFSRIMNNEELPFNSRLIERQTTMEQQYRTKLIALSPLATKSRASAYWQDIKLKIYRLMKLRVNKSFRPILSSKSFLSVVAIIVIAIFAPWYVQQFISFNASILQFFLFLFLAIAAVYTVSRGQRKSLKTSFYHHNLPCLKLVLSGGQKITHAQFNKSGKLMKALWDKNRSVVPLPYFIGKLGFELGNAQAHNFHFITNQRIKKQFKHVFSVLEHDIQPNQVLKSIQFYKKSFFLFPKRLLFEVEIERLKKTEDLIQVEKLISPIISCEVVNHQLENITLIDEVTSLEDTILNHYLKHKNPKP